MYIRKLRLSVPDDEWAMIITSSRVSVVNEDEKTHIN